MNNTKFDTLKVDFSFYDMKTGGAVTEETLKEPDLSEDFPDRGTIGCDLELFINGEKIKGFIDPYLLYPNHKDNKEKYKAYREENKKICAEQGLEPEENDSDNSEYSDFYVVSCSCGSAGCSGIGCGIFISREDGKLIWEVPACEGYEDKSNLKIGEYVFDETEYEKTFESALRKLEAKIKANGWNPDTVIMFSTVSFMEFLEYMKENNEDE